MYSNLLSLGLVPVQIDMLLGTLLGDASLQTYTKGDSWRYRALHGLSQKEYLIHKYALLEIYCDSAPAYQEVYDERTLRTYKRYYFNTLVNPAFKLLADAFYQYDAANDSWIKIVPINIKELLTPATVAYMYMDDGSLKSKGVSNAMRISTQSFTEADTVRLQAALLDRYGVRTSLHRRAVRGDKNRYVIYIPESYSSTFRELIKPFLLPSMLYKVSNGSYGTLAD